MERRRINLAYYRLTNLDAASGYDHLRRYLADLVDVRLVEPALPRHLPPRLAARLGRSRRLSYYEPAGMRLEYGVLGRLLAATDEVCHLLYAEDHFNHLAGIRHLPRGRRGALVATFHQPPSQFDSVVRFRNLRRRLEALDAAIVLCDDQAQMLRRLMAPERVHVVRHGIDCEHFQPSVGSPNGPLRCLAVGSWLRDFELLRAAIERVVAVDPAVEFEVLTRPEHHAAISGAPNTTVRSNLSSEALLESYRAADLLVHAVRDSAANNAVLEGLACGLPVVATNVGGVPEYVSGECAAMTPAGDAQAMAAAILALSADPERRGRMGEAAREAALELDWRRVARRTLAVYEDALRSRANAIAAMFRTRVRAIPARVRASRRRG